MNKVKISIIIPFYNTPIEYLNRCLTSISIQSFRNYEIILIDDGSDQGLHDSYCRIAQNHNAVLYTQHNKGVSAARNKGVSLSTGDYIAFIDSDDIIEPDFLSHGAQIAAEKDYDIIIGSIQDVSKSYSQIFTNTVVYLSDNSIEDLELALLGSSGTFFKCNPKSFYLLGSSCGKLYRKKVIQNLNFKESLKYSEDQLFNRIVFHNIHSAAIIPEIWYKYKQNSFSAMHKNYQFYLEQIKQFWDSWDSITESSQDKYLNNAAHELSLKWINGFTSEWIIPSFHNTREASAELRSVSQEKIFVHSISNLNFSNIKTLRTKLTYYLMKKCAYSTIIRMNKAMRFLLTQ